MSKRALLLDLFRCINIQMKKKVRIISYFLLITSLMWLPFSVSAVTPPPSKNTNCHEMNSVMQAQVISHVSVNKLTVKKHCCGHCGNDCSCKNMSACVNSFSHASPFIKIDLHSFSQSTELSQFMIERIAQYHNQIITPDIRPPIV